ncbi:hypothetical protein [Salinigranum marinum]|uniref:hypothetical protein n=1 Tax=Salinigranum marinum TaxID=1515595 RepID=UPI002989A341|nr:hypothetical protein [Salinigranum marinum]
MSSDPDLDAALSVTEGPVTVTKSFEPNEFPVPAIKFVLESTATEPVRIRLTDAVPEAFPMENVGFHPDFEKDNWTAYKSHRVEYERTLDPEASTTTVYGVRLDGTDPATFLTEPTLSFPEADAGPDARGAVDDVLGEDSNQIVRDVLSGERDSLPGLGEDDGVDAPDLTPDAAVDAEMTAADSSTDHAEATTDDDAEDLPPEDIELNFDEDEGDDADDAAPTDDEAPGDPDASSPHPFDGSGDSSTDDVETTAVSAVETDDAGTDDLETGELDLELDEGDDEGAPVADSGSAEGDDGHRVAGGSVVSTLAAEVRRGDADEEDVAALRDALGVNDDPAEIPRSLDLRIGRLQTQVEDLAAYAEGIREFLDDEGTAEELIEGFRADVESVEEGLEELSTRADEAADDRSHLQEDVTDLRADVSEQDDRLDGVDDRLDGITERLGGVDDRLDGVDDHLAAVDDRLDDVDARATAAEETAERLDDEMGEVREDLAALDGDVTEVRETLGEELTETREQFTDDLTETREQLTDDLAETREALDEDVVAVRDDVAALEDDLDDLGETVAEFRAFRDSLGSALGTIAGGDSAGDGADGTSDADGTGETDDSDGSDGSGEAAADGT